MTTTNTTLAPKMQLAVGSEAIMKNITSIATKGKALDSLIHLTACSVLAHVAQHREVSLVNKLLVALPKSSRKNALIEWFVTFGEMQFNEKDKLMEFQKEAKTQQDKAESVPFWDFKPEPAYHAVNLLDLIKKAVSQAEKRKSENDKALEADPNFVVLDSIDVKVLDQLKALLPVE